MTSYNGQEHKYCIALMIGYLWSSGSSLITKGKLALREIT